MGGAEGYHLSCTHRVDLLQEDGWLDGEWGAEPSPGCRKNRHESLLIGSRPNPRGLHSRVKSPRPSVKFSLWATSLQSLQNVQATKCLNNIRVTWAEKSIHLHQTE